jgi:hypothetical protein
MEDTPTRPGAIGWNTGAPPAPGFFLALWRVSGSSAVDAMMMRYDPPPAGAMERGAWTSPSGIQFPPPDLWFPVPEPPGE